MYFITHYNRFGQRYTMVKSDKPTLKLTNTVHFNYDDVGLVNTLLEKDFSYTTFRIPKASGGFRTITAPSEYLKTERVATLSNMKACCFYYWLLYVNEKVE